MAPAASSGSEARGVNACRCLTFWSSLTGPDAGVSVPGGKEESFHGVVVSCRGAGLDDGTDSVRVVADCADGRSIGTQVFHNPSGEQGILLDAKDPHLARQNPADYVDGLRATAPLREIAGSLLMTARRPA